MDYNDISGGEDDVYIKRDSITSDYIEQKPVSLPVSSNGKGEKLKNHSHHVGE